MVIVGHDHFKFSSCRGEGTELLLTRATEKDLSRRINNLTSRKHLIPSVYRLKFTPHWAPLQGDGLRRMITEPDLLSFESSLIHKHGVRCDWFAFYYQREPQAWRIPSML
jgi:hypothetical protein